MKQYANIVREYVGSVLEVGIMGDEKPGGNYYWYTGKEYKTLDILPEAKADYTMDICQTDFKDNTWDLVIISQTLEHLWDYETALKECARITKKYVIVDTPMGKYHGLPNMPDYWRFTHEAYEKLIPDSGLRIVRLFHSQSLVSALCKKLPPI